MQCFHKPLQFSFMCMCLATPLRFYDLVGKEHFFNNSQSARESAAYSRSAMNTELLAMLFPFVEG